MLKYYPCHKWARVKSSSTLKIFSKISKGVCQLSRMRHCCFIALWNYILDSVVVRRKYPAGVILKQWYSVTPREPHSQLLSTMFISLVGGLHPWGAQHLPVPPAVAVSRWGLLTTHRPHQPRALPASRNMVGNSVGRGARGMAESHWCPELCVGSHHSSCCWGFLSLLCSLAARLMALNRQSWLL